MYETETSRARVRDFIPGTYIFSLVVTDNEGAKAWGKAKVVVNSRPIVSAGEDQVLIWPLNHTILKGKVTDKDGQTLSLEWRRGSNPPSEPNIVSPYTFETEVKDLELGEYEFRFSARDEACGFDHDKVTVKVVESDNFSH